MVELLIALAIGGLVTGSILQVLTGQARFVELQTAREEVQQNTRASLELIGSELRGVPGGDALVRVARDSITFHSPRLWGVLCAVNTGLSADVVFPTIPEMSYVTNLGTALGAIVGSPAEPRIVEVADVLGIGGPEPECGGEPLGAGAEKRTLTLSGAVEGWGAQPGDVVYLYDRVTYRTGVSSGLPGAWIQRRIGDGPGTSNQPFAGPVAGEGEGLRFEYFAEGATAPLPTPVTDAAARASIDRIAVIVSAISRHPRSDFAQTRTDTILVPLRNRVRAEP